MKNKIKVMIVDDHALIRTGLKQLLEFGDDIEVIASATNGSECLQLLENCAPDIIFMDVKMQGITGIETTKIISKKYPNIKVVILTIYDDTEYVTEAVQAGAKGYILKNTDRVQLMNAISHIINNKAYLDPIITQVILNNVKKGRTSQNDTQSNQLTQRELEVIEEICSGKKDDDIADFLHISKHTVRSHIKNIYRKLGVSSKYHLTAKAIQLGVIVNELMLTKPTDENDT